MGMLLHNTLVEMEEKNKSVKRETMVEKPVENPTETEPEPVRKTGGRRKTSK